MITQTEKNILIAKDQEWTMDRYGWWSHPTLPDNGGAMPEPPDYFNDLNAMHEAEASLDDKGHFTFRKNLWDVVADTTSDDWDDRQYISATAAQRAEAYGITRKLW